jgi:hypothetical protein
MAVARRGIAIVAKRGTFTAISARAFISWTSNFEPDRRCCAMDWPDCVGRRIDIYIARIVARAALDGSG